MHFHLEINHQLTVKFLTIQNKNMVGVTAQLTSLRTPLTYTYIHAFNVYVSYACATQLIIILDTSLNTDS